MKCNLIALPFVLATVSANALVGHDHELERRSTNSIPKGCRLATLTRTRTVTTVYTTVVTVESVFCGGALKPTSTERPAPVPVEAEAEVATEAPPLTSSKPLPGACRTSVITTVSNNVKVPTSVKICPYPPFTFTIPKESPSPIGKPSTEEEPVDEEVPIDKPPTSTVLLDGACVTRTTEIVSDKKTITTVTTACPYPDRKPLVSKSPIPIKKTQSTELLDGACVTRTTEIISNKTPITTVTTFCPRLIQDPQITDSPSRVTPRPTASPSPKGTEEGLIEADDDTTSTALLDGACVTRTTEIVSNKKTITTTITACPILNREDPTTTPKPNIPKPTPLGKGTGCPPSRIQKVHLTCLGEKKKKCKTPCTSTVTVTSSGACSCIGAKALVTGTTLGPIMCPDYCGCKTSTTWEFPAACKTLKAKPPKPTVNDDEEDGYGSGGY
ncbi:hypothetical protein TWF679_009456 [Orbilia oligospora]|uniref:Uncharacterized protein n=1 Tax=Orbilia oligospora TaxID=2813651 RepID=A0A8H8V2H9_ORBOL|nr:hypothetical protein TWF679_009456 [Orbilia oligospora]